LFHNPKNDSIMRVNFENETQKDLLIASELKMYKNSISEYLHLIN